MKILRPDQLALKMGIRAEWDKGAQNVMGVLPTGGGKSVIVSDLALEHAQLGRRHLIGAHRNELVGQMSMHIASYGIKHRLIASAASIREITALHRAEFNGKSFINPDANTAVSSVDTVNARADDLRQWAKSVDDVTMDEGHHVLRANKWGRMFGLFPNARGLLVTASPGRADRLGLGRHADGIVDAMVLGPDMRWLIDNGALCDYEIAIPDSDFEVDDDDFNSEGELSPKKGREASKRSHIVGDVVNEYVKRALGKRFILFATDVETAGEMAQRFNDMGIPVASVSAKTPSDVRGMYVRKFRTGQLFGLINVDLFGEGFDVPACEVVIMARPTGSLAVYLQQFGRALRLMAGKRYGLIIDHVSNWKRHGFPDKPHYWTLDRVEKRAKKEKDPEELGLTVCRGTKEAPGCSRPYREELPACPYCGTVPPLPAPADRTPMRVAGDLTLISIELAAEMRKAMYLESPASMATRVGAVAGPVAALGAANRQIERLGAQQRLNAAIEQWAGCQRALGRSDQETFRRFFLTTGIDCWSALALDRKEMEALAARVEGWYL